MNTPANQSVMLSRRQLGWGLVLAFLALVAGIWAAALLFTFSEFALLLPVPAAILLLALVFLQQQEQPVATTPAANPTESVTLAADPAPKNSVPVERPVTVDEEREVYGIYATLQTMSSSLSLSDTLNLVADRLGRLIPGATLVFALAETADEPLTVAAIFGRYANLFTLGEEITDATAAAAARTERRALTGAIWPKRFEPATARADERGWPAIAAPIIFENLAYGAIMMFRGEGRGFIDAETVQLESIAIFASAGIHQALTQKQTRDTAMLDPILHLPNVRAAFTIVDQRIAESLRRRADEPLGLICLRMDTAFDSDHELKEVCDLVGPQLRHMDILTRGEGGELLIVLPRSGRPEAALVANRILRAFKERSPALRANVYLGSASFPADGATSSELFASAREHSRSPEAQKIDRSFDNVVLVDEWR